MLLPHPNSFREQPLSRPTINWGNLLTRGLIVSLYNCPQDATLPPFNYVNGKSGTRSAVSIGAPATVVSEGGGWINGTTAPGIGSGSGPRTRINGGAKFNGSTSWSQLPLDLSPYLQPTIAFWYRRTTATDSVSIEYGPNFNPNGFLIDPQSPSKMLYATQATSTQFAVLSAQIPLNEWHHHVIAIDRTLPAGLASWQIDGASAQYNLTGTSITTNVALVANGNLNLGARNGGASAFGAMEIAGLHIWNRQLPSAESLRVYREGWRMFNPVRRALIPTTSAPIDPSLSDRWFLLQ